MQESSDVADNCVKCDLLFCQEYGVPAASSAELPVVNEEQRDSVKRVLSFSDVRDPNHDDDSDGTNSTVSNENLSPSQIPLPYSSTESLNDTPKQKEWSFTPNMNSLQQNLTCDEVMSLSPDAKAGHENALLNEEETKSETEFSDDWSDLELPDDEDESNARQVVYLNNKRQHSQFAYDASGNVIIVKKKRRE